MIDLMQAMSGAGKNEDHISAARNVWKALDDMAEADPEQYDKFIQQQMNQAQDLGLKKPASQPGVVLTVFVESTSSITAAVISLFEQEECPQPSEAGKPWNPSSVQLPNMRVKFRVRRCPFASTRVRIWTTANHQPLADAIMLYRPGRNHSRSKLQMESDVFLSWTLTHP